MLARWRQGEEARQEHGRCSEIVSARRSASDPEEPSLDAPESEPGNPGQFDGKQANSHESAWTLSDRSSIDPAGTVGQFSLQFIPNWGQMSIGRMQIWEPIVCRRQ